MDKLKVFTLNYERDYDQTNPHTLIADEPCAKTKCKHFDECKSRLIACKAFFQYVNRDSWTAIPGNPSKKWYDMIFNLNDKRIASNHREVTAAGRISMAKHRDEIIDAALNGESLREIGKRYGVSHDAVGKALRRVCQKRNPKLFRKLQKNSKPRTNELWKGLVKHKEEFKGDV